MKIYGRTEVDRGIPAEPQPFQGSTAPTLGLPPRQPAGEPIPSPALRGVFFQRPAANAGRETVDLDEDDR